MIKSYLLAPGPTPVPPEVLAALAQPVIHHRTPQFSAVLAEVQTQLRRLFGTTQDVLVLAASGTGAMEGSVTNLLSPGDEALAVNGGVRRALDEDMPATVSRRTRSRRVGSAARPDQVAEALAAHPQARAGSSRRVREVPRARIRSRRSQS